jgi:CheY-like chemotaxis protein
MARILGRRPGIELQHAADGHTGLAIVRSRRPDLVLLDMHLPDMTGDEVIERLSADPATRHVPIAVVTADATPGLVRRVKEAGAARCLTKPLDIKEVLQVIDDLLKKDARANSDV